MSATEENRHVVRRMVQQSMIEGDVDGALAAYAADFSYHNPVLKAMPKGLDTRDAVRQLTTQTRDAFPDMRYAISAVIAEEDMVAVLYTWSGTHTGGLAGIPPTGRSVTATGAIFCRLAGGRIVEQWDIDDRLDAMQQLGLFPVAASDASGPPGE